MKTYNVVCALIMKEGKVFCCKRGPGRDLEGFYEFPGGKIEPGETREQAIVREIKEELKSDILVDSYFTTIDYDYPLFHLTMHAYICYLVNGNLDLTEHTDKKWISISELNGVDFAPADKIIVEKLIKNSNS